MVNWINSWLRGIVIAVIITTIIEMIIPEGNIKKYIKTVMGVYIIFAIISPAISKISGKELDIEKYIKSQTSKYQQPEINTIDTNYYIEQTYLENIKKEIVEELIKRGYIVNEFRAEIETGEIEYGKIKKIEMKIVKNENKIENVEISVGKNEKKKREKLSQEELKNIKSFLETTYGIAQKNITIS